MEIKDYLRILRRRWLAILVVFVAGLAFSSTYLTRKKTVTYTSSAEIMLLESTFDRGWGWQEADPIPVISLEQRVRMLRSHQLAEYLLARLRDPAQELSPALQQLQERAGTEDLRDLPRTIWEQMQDLSDEDRARLAEKFSKYTPQTLRSMIRLGRSEQSEIIQMSITHTDPDVPRYVLMAAIAEFRYQEQNQTLIRYKNAVKFLSGQIAKDGPVIEDLKTLKAQLAEMRTALAKAMGQSGVFEPEEQALFQQRRIESLQNELHQTTVAIQTTLTRRRQANERKQTFPVAAGFSDDRVDVSPPSNAGPIAKDLAARRMQLRVELATLQKKYHEVHPRIEQIKKQINMLDSLILEFSSSDTNTKQEVDALNTDLKILEDKKEFISDTINESWGRVQTLGSQADEINAVKRQIQDQENRARQISDDILNMERRIEGSSSDDRVRTLQAPTVPVASYTDTTTTILLAGFVCLLLAFGAGYMLEYLSNTIETSNDIRTYLNLATVGVIPNLKDAPRSLFDVEYKDPAWETYNRLSTMLESIATEQSSRTLLVTSPKPGDGKSTISHNVAIAMAQGGTRVILIDSDMRKPQIHTYFKTDNSRGLSDLLNGEWHDARERAEEFGTPAPEVTDYLHDTSIPSLRVLPCGPIPPNPISLLKSQNLEKLLDELKQHADLIILDSPPLLSVIDAAVIGAIADLTLLVISEGKVTRGEGTQAKNSLEQVGANIAGAVINKAEHQPDAYYYYYYRYRGY